MAVLTKQQHRHHYENQDLWDKFWKDKDGNVVVWQWPNVWLYIWLGITLVSFFFSPGSMTNTVLWYASLADLAVWAILEAWKGVNYFRKSVGAVVLLLIILAVFKVGY